MPLRKPNRRQVEGDLGELLGWREIARSPQLANFLSYIVMAKLRGEEAGIKANAIAVDIAAAIGCLGRLFRAHARHDDGAPAPAGDHAAAAGQNSR